CNQTQFRHDGPPLVSGVQQRGFRTPLWPGALTRKKRLSGGQADPTAPRLAHPRLLSWSVANNRIDLSVRGLPAPHECDMAKRSNWYMDGGSGKYLYHPIQAAKAA